MTVFKNPLWELFFSIAELVFTFTFSKISFKMQWQKSEPTMFVTVTVLPMEAFLFTFPSLGSGSHTGTIFFCNLWYFEETGALTDTELHISLSAFSEWRDYKALINLS